MKITRVLLALLIITAGCGKKGDSPDDNKPDGNPAAAVLQSPAPNEICTSGTILSDTTADITFKWAATPNIKGYRFYVRDIDVPFETGIMKELTANSVTVTLKRNKPYSWTVITSNNIGSTDSEERRFYLAGKGTTTYAPFPAELLTPKQGESIATSFSSITLSWKGSSVSKNIVGYDLYFGSDKNPPLLAGDIYQYDIQYYDAPIAHGKTYFWRVVTKDANGNKSTSPLFQFDIR